MSADADEDSKRWRALAAEALDVAAQMTDPGARKIMLDIAHGYLSLTEHLEARKRNKPSS
jgi:hypothetical protein